MTNGAPQLFFRGYAALEIGHRPQKIKRGGFEQTVWTMSLISCCFLLLNLVFLFHVLYFLPSCVFPSLRLLSQHCPFVWGQRGHWSGPEKKEAEEKSHNWYWQKSYGPSQLKKECHGRCTTLKINMNEFIVGLEAQHYGQLMSHINDQLLVTKYDGSKRN